jgi:hypothetical protein
MRLQVAIACFLIVLGAVELLQWFQKRNLPMPVLVMGGMILAVGSNYNKLPMERLRDYLPKMVFEDSSQTSEPE